MSQTTAATPISIIEKLEQQGHQALTAIEHAAAWLVSKAAFETISLHNLEATDPWVGSALAAGIKSAEAHGVPVVDVQNAGLSALTLARSLAAGLASPPAPAPKAADATVATSTPAAA